MNVVCAECGAEQELEAEGLEGRCTVCRATLVASAASRTFEPAPRKRKKKPRKSPVAVHYSDRELRSVARSGLRWLLLALACSVTAVVAAACRLWFHATDGDVLAAQWVGRIAGGAGAVGAFLAASAWRPLGKPLDHFAPTEWAWKLAAGLVPIALLAPFLPEAIAMGADVVWLAGWALYLLLVTVLQRICIRIGRSDLRDSADFVLSMGTGVVVFAFAAFALALVPLAPLLALAAMLYGFSMLCLPLWGWSYAWLLLRMRAALR